MIWFFTQPWVNSNKTTMPVRFVHPKYENGGERSGFQLAHVMVVFQARSAVIDPTLVGFWAIFGAKVVA